MSIDIPAWSFDETGRILQDLVDRGIGQAIDEIPKDEIRLSFVHYPEDEQPPATKPEEIYPIRPSVLILAHQILDCRTDGLGCTLGGCTLQPTSPDTAAIEATDPLRNLSLG